MKACLKTIVLSAVTAFAAFSAVTYSSCNNDKCKAIACAYGGVCKDGDCICPSGYEGTQCETITRDKYVGVWAVMENGTYTETSAFDVSIKPGLTMTDLVITNFYNKPDLNVGMKIKGDSIFIPQQVVTHYQIQGWGILDRDAYYAKHGKMDVHYTITDLDNGLTDDFGLHTGEISVWSK
jgi:hypothetical protein